MALVALVAPAAALAVPPGNDDYLKSTRINAPGSRVPREEVKDARQHDRGDDAARPLRARGAGRRWRPRDTTCQGRSFGKTVWYDLHPDVDGAVEIQTGGFDVAIAIYEFDQSTSKIVRPSAARPSPARRTTSPRSLEGGATTRSSSAA